MPVYVVVVRQAVCCICENAWTLQPFEHPEVCAHCGSPWWEFGVESADTRLIRQGISRLRRRLNAGVKHRNRKVRADAQHQSFHPKAESEPKVKPKVLPRIGRGRGPKRKP